MCAVLMMMIEAAVWLLLCGHLVLRKDHSSPCHSFVALPAPLFLNVNV